MSCIYSADQILLKKHVIFKDFCQILYYFWYDMVKVKYIVYIWYSLLIAKSHLAGSTIRENNSLKITEI